MKILAVDTTASPVSAALMDDGRLLGEIFLNIHTTHSQTLMPAISSLLSNTGVKADEIDIFAVNSGPGSFTGVRIGVASVKGMAMPFEKPCAGVSTLDAMAYGVPFEGIVCAVMDARCSQVYNAVFRTGEGSPERLTPDRAVSIDELRQELEGYDEKVWLVGDGAELCYSVFGKELAHVRIAPENLRFQRAYGTAAAALEMAAQGRLCSPAELMPHYLRLPQAERERRQRLERQDNK